MGGLSAVMETMPQAANFLAWDREQELLLPPSLGEWLPEHQLEMVCD